MLYVTNDTKEIAIDYNNKVKDKGFKICQQKKKLNKKEDSNRETEGQK